MDSVAYIVMCYCNEEIYASWDRIDQKIKYWPEIKYPDCHDPITECKGCGRKITEVESQQYDDAMDCLP